MDSQDLDKNTAAYNQWRHPTRGQFQLMESWKHFRSRLAVEAGTTKLRFYELTVCRFTVPAPEFAEDRKDCLADLFDRRSKLGIQLLFNPLVILRCRNLACQVRKSLYDGDTLCKVDQ